MLSDAYRYLIPFGLNRTYYKNLIWDENIGYKNINQCIYKGQLRVDNIIRGLIIPPYNFFVIGWKQGRRELMLHTGANKATEILRILTNAEKQGQNLYSPLIQIESSLKYLEDDNLLALYQRLLHGFNAATTDEQSWADDYFTFILQLCDLLNKTKTNVNQDSLTGKATISLVPA